MEMLQSLLIVNNEETYLPNDVHDHILVGVTNRDEIATSDHAGPVHDRSAVSGVSSNRQALQQLESM